MQKIMANASELAKNASDAELVANVIVDAARTLIPAFDIWQVKM